MKSPMKLGMLVRSLPAASRICKCEDQLLMNFGPLILLHWTWKAVILVPGLYFNVILKALFRFGLLFLFRKVELNSE